MRLDGVPTASPSVEGELVLAARPLGLARTHTPLFAENRVELRVAQPSTLPAVLDFAEVGRAVSELLKNAACYAPPSSVVGLHARLDDGAIAEITVSDEGPGIDHGG